MPNWKKVIVSGSDAYLRNITASGDISASGLLHASLSFDTTPSTDGVVVYDTAGGRFYYTGSYGGGSGGTIIVKEDGVITVAAATTIDFLNSTVTESPSGEANVGFDLQGVTDSGAVTTNKGLFLHNQNAEYGFSNSQLAKSGFEIDNSKAYTYATPQRTQNDVYLLGMHMTSNGVGPYPDNFITINKELVYIGESGPYDGGGGGTNPDEDHPDDLGGLLLSTGTGFQILASSSISSITKDNKARGIYITPSAFYMFNTDASASVSGTLVPESASAQIRFNTASNAVQFLAGSTNETLKEVLFISRSGDNPRIGIGTTNPLRAFDFKEIRDDSRGGELLIRGSRTTKGADVADEAGRINFAIDSSSYNNIETSGSTAEIVALVDQIDTSGVKGSLSLRVSSVKGEAPIEKLRITPAQIQATGSFVISGSNSFTNIGPATFSGSVAITDTLGVDGITTHNNNVVISNGLLDANDSGVKIRGTAGLTIGDNIIPGAGQLRVNDFSMLLGGAHVGGTSDPGTDNLLVDGTTTLNDLIVKGTASIAYFETLYETSSIIYSSGSTKFGDTMDDFHDFTGSVNVSGSTDIEGNLSVSGGTIDLKNSGAASKILLYCESNNAHAQTIQGAPHSDAASNTLVLPSTGTKFATQDGTETFTNKTLTSPDIDGGTIDNTVIGNSTANAGTFTSLTATNITASGNISSSGTIIGSNLSGTNTGDQDLSSYSTIVQLNASSSALQSNIDAKASITQLNASSSALQSNIDAKASITQLNASSSALQTNIDAKASITQLNASSSALQTNIDAKASITQLTATQSLLQTNIDAKLSNSSTASFAITGSNVTFAEITASNLDISGDVDVDGTLEADAITVNGAALSSVIAGTTVANAVNTSNVNIAATTDNADFFITMVDGATSDQKVESSTKLKFNPSNGNFFIDGHITASGDISASGTIVGSNLSGTNTGDQDLSSYSTIVQLNASSSALQTNIDAKASITQLNASSSALQSNIDAKASIAQLNASSSALQTNISTNTSNISTNTTNITSLTDIVSTVTTVIGSDSITNVDTFATSTYNGAIYDYILKDSTVGARAGQFMVAHDDGNVTFTDTSTRHLSDSTIPEITADISGADVRVRVTNGNGYTFKSFVKKL
jgi:hypothetical protein